MATTDREQNIIRLAEDTLKQAVELADGFLFDDGQFFIVHESGGLINGGWLDTPYQWFLDALAAQLARQCKSDEFTHFTIDEDYTLVFNDEQEIRVDGPDWIENTINACVEFLTNQKETT